VTKSVKVLALSGLGLVPLDPATSLNKAIESRPEVIAMDAGSGDIGPYYLGADGAYNPDGWERNDLEHLLLAARRLDVPLIVGSAGGAGTNRSVDLYADAIRDIAEQHSLGPISLARIYAELSQDVVLQKLRAGAVTRLGATEELTEETIRQSTRFVALMGVQPIVRALHSGANVIIAGRACDDALHAAYPILVGLPPAIAFLAGKTMENASTAATPFMARESLLGTLTSDDLLLEAVVPDQSVTVFSLTAEIFYERRNPFRQAGPGGCLDLSELTITPEGRGVRLKGAQYVEDPVCKVKMEGAGFRGFRSLSIVGIRDPRMIARIDSVLLGIRHLVSDRYRKVQHHLFFHVYGKDAIMRSLEPTKTPAHELGVLIEVSAPTQALADEISIFAKRSNFLARYEGQKATAGSVSYTVDECLPGLPAYVWTADHLVELADPYEWFPMEMESIA
jgi:hypothetical protein